VRQRTSSWLCRWLWNSSVSASGTVRFVLAELHKDHRTVVLPNQPLLLLTDQTQWQTKETTSLRPVRRAPLRGVDGW
jgi:hypothetical protein